MQHVLMHTFDLRPSDLLSCVHVAVTPSEFLRILGVLDTPQMRQVVLQEQSLLWTRLIDNPFEFGSAHALNITI